MPEPTPHEPTGTASDDALWLDVLAAVWNDRLSGREVRPELHAQRFAAHGPALIARLERLSAGITTDAAATTPATIGQIGPYLLRAELGRGGQAVVYEAEEPVLRRTIALKVLRPGPAFLSSAEARFAREAALAARLEDPGLCAIYATGQDSGQLWLAMRLLPGGTWRERLGTRAAAGEVPTAAATRAAAATVTALARTLHRLHEAGVVHRDLKPGNVGFDEQDRPVLLDLGLATATDDELQMTHSDESVGTPAYMAPEQVDGRPVDRRADVHALGVLLHEAIALRHPFTGSAAEPPTRERLYRAILDQDASSLRTTCPGAGVDRDLEAVLATAMAKDADRRYATAKALADDLQRWLDRVPVIARRVTMLGRLRRWAQRRPALAAALAGTFLALAAGLSVTTHLLVRLQGEQTRTAAALAHARATALRAEAANAHAASPRTALHLALAAHDLEPGEPSRSAVYAAWTRLPEHATLPAGSDTLVRAANSPDRACCVLGCADGSARLVSLRDQRVTALPGGNGPVTAAAVADGGALVLLAHGPVLTVWRDDAPPVRVVCERTIYAIARTADGNMITGHADGRLVVRDVLGQPRRELQALAAAVASLAVAANGSVAACAVDGQVQLTTAAGEVLAAWHAAPDAVTTVTALKRGVLLVPSPAARTVRLFDVATATPRDVAVPFALARCCAVGDGRRLALLGTWGQAHLLDLASGRTSPLAGGAAVHALAADERGAIAFATSDGDLAVVLPDGRRRHTHIGDTPVRWLEFTADGRLHAATEDGAGLVWALHSVCQCQPDGNDGVHTLACFAPDGTLLGGVRGGVACVPVDGPATVLPATPNAVAAVVAAADGNHLLAVLKDGHVEALARDGTLRCRVAAAAAPGPCSFVGAERFVCLDDQCARLFALDGRLLATLAIDGRRTTALAVAPSGRFAVGSEAGDVVVCDPDGTRLYELAAASHVDAMEFGPSDELAIAERTGELLVASADGASRAGWRAHRGRIASIDFAPTGQRLLVAGDDGTAAVFDLAGQRQRHLQPGGGPLLGARFLHRRGLIATVTRQGAVHLWSDSDGALFCAVPVADRPPLDFCVAPTEDRLVLSGYACAFTVLPLDEATLLGRARELAHDLPAPERARYAALLDPEPSR